MKKYNDLSEKDKDILRRSMAELPLRGSPKLKKLKKITRLEAKEARIERIRNMSSDEKYDVIKHNLKLGIGVSVIISMQFAVRGFWESFFWGTVFSVVLIYVLNSKNRFM